MPIQAQDAANRNALSQQAIQNGQNTLDESQNQRDTGNAFANMIAQSHKATPAEPPVAPQTQSAPITSAGPLAVPSAPRAIVPLTPSLSSLMSNPNALTANQSQVLQSPQPAQAAPVAPAKQAIAQSQGSTPTLTPLADHPAVQNFLASTPNTNPDTKKAVDPDNPTFAAQHTFDSVDPKTGAVIHNTFDRQSLIDQMMNYTDKNGNHVMAGDANKLMSQFTLSDAADEKAKQDKIAAGHAQALMLSAGLEYLPPAQQAAVYSNIKGRADQMGEDTSTWPKDPNDPNFKPWVAQQGEEARMNANTAKEASKRAEDAFNDLKARAEAQRDLSQGVEAQAKAGTEPSIRNRNNSEAFKAYQEGLKSKSEIIAPTAPSGSYPLNSAINPKDAKTDPNDAALAPQNRGIDLTKVPTEYQGLINSLTKGDLLLSDIPARSAKGPSKTQIEQWLTDAAPNYSAPQMELQKKALGTFAAKNGDNINSLNALSEHLQLARYLAPALNNGDVMAWNQLGNSLGQQFGKDNKTNFETLTGVLGGETDKFMSGNNPTQTGSAEWQKRLKSSGSPTQIEGTLQTLEKAVGGKFSGIAQAYRQATGGRRYLTDQDTNFLTPQASALMQKYEPGAGRPSTPQPAASQPPANYNKQQAIQDAKAAIAAGAPRDAVLARSKSIGHDLTGAF
jgi:hypothetical protein